MSESNINVAVKMRPLIKRELEKKIPVCWKINQDSLVDTVLGTNEFSFDLTFDENSNTVDLYDKVARPIVVSALAGVNGTIFAYGQTSSGKTHTMMGDENNDGIMLLAIKHIFSEVQGSNIEFVLRVGFIEIYNEKVYDLYDPDNVDLRMVEKNNDAYVNCKEAICKCVDDMYNVIKIGNKNKKIGDTDMNDRSSRSHTIFRISIESIDAISEKAKISNLNLVDLAGSERVSQTNSTGARFVEGAHINKSLLTLSMVINKLINNERCHINYRDSKLTRYLQSSLGGNALAAIICTICPTTLDETCSTLYFAQRAMKVTNKPRVNEIISDATMIKQLHNQIKVLKDQLELEKSKHETNSAVPRILQELSLHQGNILNYHKAEHKAKLRRRTWTTFDNDLAVISESTPLVLADRKQSLSDFRGDAVAPVLHMITADRGSGVSFDALSEREEMDLEFDFKSKYVKLLNDYEELQEFTDWENKLGVEPDKTAPLQTRIDHLETENRAITAQLVAMEQERDSMKYLQEQHKKQADQRVKDLVDMMEELKKGILVNTAIEEKNGMIQELQEQLGELGTANNGLQIKIGQYQDMEERLVKMGQVQVELDELKATITILKNTISTLELEKQEMSIRMNESITGTVLENSQMPAPPTLVVQYCQTDAMPEDTKLQADYDELSCKVMELIEENEDLKQQAQDWDKKLIEMTTKTQELQAHVDNSVKEQSERNSLEETIAQQLKEIERLSSRSACQIADHQVQLQQLEEVSLQKTALEHEIDILCGEQNRLLKDLELSNEIQEQQTMLKATIAQQQEELQRLATEPVRKIEEYQMKLIELEEIKMAKCALDLDMERVSGDRDRLLKELESRTSEFAKLCTDNQTLAGELEKSEQQTHALMAERDCLANDLRENKVLISDWEKKIEVCQSEQTKNLTDLRTENARLATEIQSRVFALEQQKHDHELTVQKILAEAEEIRASKDREVAHLQAIMASESSELQQHFADQLNSLMESKKTLERQIEELSEEVQTTIKECEIKLQTQTNVHGEEKATWHQEMQTIRAELEHKSEALRTMENHIKTVDDVVPKMAALEQERDRLQSELEKQGVIEDELRLKGEQIDELLKKFNNLEGLLETERSAKEELVQELQSEKENLLHDLSTAKAEQKHADETLNRLSEQLRAMEEETGRHAKELLAAHEEIQSLGLQLRQAADKCAEIDSLTQENAVVRNRVSVLEGELKLKEERLVELSHHRQQTLTHEEEVSKLQSHIKKLRSELSEFQNKGRRTRRSSTFDQHRDLMSDRSVGTMTDPVSETCQCEALSEKVNELKRNNMLKDLQMVELREAEKRSPMLLENYNLKKANQQHKEKVTALTKDLAKMEQKLYQTLKQHSETKKTNSEAVQTMPDGNIQLVADLRREVALKTTQCEESKLIVINQQDRISFLEGLVGEAKENRMNETNVPEELITLRKKYNVVKGVVEKRYFVIRELEKEQERLQKLKTCLVCQRRAVATLQVPM